MKNLLNSLLLVASMATALQAEAKDYVVASPDGHLCVTVNDDAALTWSISRTSAPQQTQMVMLPSPIGITTDAGYWGEARQVRSTTTRTISRDIKPVAYKRAEIHETCNEMTLRCRGDFDLVVRVYNDREATDYAHSRRTVQPGEELTITLAPGGGWAAVVE